MTLKSKVLILFCSYDFLEIYVGRRLVRYLTGDDIDDDDDDDDDDDIGDCDDKDDKV